MAGLRPCRIEWVKGWGVNPYPNCPLGCTYCWARKLEVRFNRWTEAATLEEVERDLSRLRDPQHTRVLVSPMVDPYPPKEVVTRWTRRILEHLLEAGVHVMVLTKSPLVCEDYGLLAAYENVEVGFSITSLDAIYEWEPTIYDNLQRISALKWAHRHGLKTFVSLEPWILGVDPLRIIDELEPYVDRWIIGKLNYNGVPADYYRPHIPRLLRRLHATGRPFMVKKELARLHTGRNEPIVRGEGWP